MADYTNSLAAMMLRLGISPCAERIITVSRRSTLLPMNRLEIAREAIQKYGATHLLWIDADHRFPPDTAHRLMAHGQPFVGINATTRRGIIQYTALKESGKQLETRPDMKGLESVWRMGFGIVLVEARVFQAIEQPWFSFEWVEDGRALDLYGEDVYFCEKAKAAGFTPYVDHDLSKETAHIGVAAFDCSDVAE